MGARNFLVDRGDAALNTVMFERDVDSLDLELVKQGLGEARVSGVVPRRAYPTPTELYSGLLPINRIPPSPFNGTPKLLAILNDYTLATPLGSLRFRPGGQDNPNTALWGINVLLAHRGEGPVYIPNMIQVHKFGVVSGESSRPELAASGMFARLGRAMGRIGLDVFLLPARRILLERGLAVADFRK